jgi:hypothetical protein
MLENNKFTYALSMWSVEKRANGWYFSKSAYHGDKHSVPICRQDRLEQSVQTVAFA